MLISIKIKCLYLVLVQLYASMHLSIKQLNYIVHEMWNQTVPLHISVN